MRGVFVYWYESVWTGTKSIRLLVYGWDRTIQLLVRVIIVYSGLRTGPFLTWFAVELSNSRSTECYWNGSNFVYCRPVRTKIKWSIHINEHTLGPGCYGLQRVCSFIGTDRSGPVPKTFVYWYCWDRKWNYLTVGPQSGAEPFIFSGPFQYRSVPINEHTQRLQITDHFLTSHNIYGNLGLLAHN
jgi:hypothetical protein